MLESRWKRWTFILSIVVTLLASLSMFYTKAVAVKMLPFDNKNEFQVVIDMPAGTTLEKTQAVAKDIADYVSRQSLVRNYQAYIGTSAPISFNGLVRHYDLRRGDNVADIQVNLVDKKDRRLQSHEIAKQMRGPIQAIAQRYHANVKIVEVPPGPPVLSTLVAEIYRPNYIEQRRIAEQVKNLLHKTSDVVDVDWMMEENQLDYHISVDKEKAIHYGLATTQIAATVNAALSGMNVGIINQPSSYSQTAIKLQLSDRDKASINDLLDVNMIGLSGNAVPHKRSGNGYPGNKTEKHLP